MNKELADLLFPEIASGLKPNRTFYENIYCKVNARDTTNGQEYMRLAPSPTGELHAGTLYLAILQDRLTHESGGKLILRVEDTDKLREVEGATDRMIENLKLYGVNIDESPITQSLHGPYIQSERRDIYNAFIYDFLSRGLAYPCFMTEDELATLRETQTLNKVRPGIYGQYAKNRDLTNEEIKNKIEGGFKYVIRLKSTGDFDRKITFVDELMGKLELSENDEDFVIAKTDGIPTYHLAHLVDDYLMGITFVLRANEWVASITKHLELWKCLNREPVRYGHIMPINKRDGNSIRKLSKRKDSEASVAYYIQEGYTVDAVNAYLLRLANPSFDEWWDEQVKQLDARQINKINLNDYKLNLDELKRNSRGPLLDFDKLNNMSADILAGFDAQTIYNELTTWANVYDRELYETITLNPNYTKDVLNIERETEKKRKDIYKLSVAKENIFYMYDNLFNQAKLEDGNNTYDVSSINDNILNNIKENLSNDIHYNNEVTLDEWMNYVKTKYSELPPGQIKFGEYMMIIRKLITKRSKTPNLYYVLKILGRERVLSRLTF